MQIRMITQPLSDGSTVYDVALEEDGQKVVIAAFTRSDALRLIDKIREAIEAHGCYSVEVAP